MLCLALFVAGLSGSCAGRSLVLHPTFPEGGLLRDAVPLAQEVLDGLEGMYAIEGKAGPLTGLVVVHAAPGTLSLFAAPQDAYAIMKGGCIEGGKRVVFEGHWRHPTESDTGLIQLFVEQPEIVTAACTKTPLAATPSTITFSGATGERNDMPLDAMRLSFDRALVDAGPKFLVAAHHGACRTIDDCGASENSVETIKMVESFGASVVEIDVRLTADGVPILYHDETFTPRLSRGTYCHGPVSEFTFAQVRALCTLRYGEEIPTLEEALTAAINDTTLAAVWLDLKIPEAVAPAIDIVKKYNALAVSMKGRKFVAVIGMGETEIVDAFVAAGPPDVPCLVELELDDVRRADCQMWGPRWTRGPMPDEVATMQKEGRSVVYWTIDEQIYVDLFLTEGKPNGVLTDRPGMVLQRFQTLGTVPATSTVKP